jgi:hypothetical protein
MAYHGEHKQRGTNRKYSSAEAYHVSFMSARTDCTAGQAVPPAATALMNISRISPLGVEVAISRRIMVF